MTELPYAGEMKSTWSQPGLSSDLIRHLRAVNRVTRTEIDDHRYAYPDLKEAWLSEDKDHIVLTHTKDRSWHHWVLSEEGWQFVGVYKSRSVAQDAAENYQAEVASPEAGIWVIARVGEQGRPIKVRCTSNEGPTLLQGIFTRLDYEVSVETVA